MGTAAEAVTLALPRSANPDVTQLSASLPDRMHHPLERSTDAGLSAVEREGLDTLERMAQFGQIVSTDLNLPAEP